MSSFIFATISVSYKKINYPTLFIFLRNVWFKFLNAEISNVMVYRQDAIICFRSL